ncbi:hypothetical protein P3547_19820 [Vibrio parahaemolyticus]|nr:hypothetical protein [Vibrio parahaemolyticus]
MTNKILITASNVAEDVSQHIIQAINAELAFVEISDLGLIEALLDSVDSFDIASAATRTIKAWTACRQGFVAMTYAERLKLSQLVTMRVAQHLNKQQVCAIMS